MAKSEKFRGWDLHVRLSPPSQPDFCAPRKASLKNGRGPGVRAENRGGRSVGSLAPAFGLIGPKRGVPTNSPPLAC